MDLPVTQDPDLAITNVIYPFTSDGYFPTHLATAFTVALISGEHSVTDEMMIDSFLLSQSERDLVSCAL